MKIYRFLSFILILLFTISLITACSENVDISPNANSQLSNAVSSHENIANTFLTAVFTCNTELLKDSTPSNLWDYYTRAIRDPADAWDFVDSLDISLSDRISLSNEEIYVIETDYIEGTGIYLSIDEAYLYRFEIIAYFTEDNGELDSEDENGTVVVAKINGEWYAFFDDPLVF